MSDYYSDECAWSSEEEEEEEPVEEIYCPREVDYWKLEDAMALRPPPMVLCFLEKVCVVSIRECIVKRTSRRLDTVVDGLSARNWERLCDGRKAWPAANITFDEWRQIFEYSAWLCNLLEQPRAQAYACMVNLLSYGHYS